MAYLRNLARAMVLPTLHHRPKTFRSTCLVNQFTTNCVVRMASKISWTRRSLAGESLSATEEDSNSDSDDEDKHPRPNRDRGSSEFWRRKMRTFHSIIDVNKDGVISFDDFLLLSQRFTEMAHMTEEDNREFNNLMQDVWELQYGPISPYNLITVEQFLEEIHHSLNDKYLRKKVHLFLPYLFKAIDKDKSGVITLDEYKLFFKCLGLGSEDAALSFNAIDDNSDGKVTKQEFVHLGREFFLSEDESKSSKWFWGQLIRN